MTDLFGLNRLDVREQILCCEACNLCRVGNGPIPFSGPVPAEIAIVGEAPGQDEDSKGEPFIGRAGQLLRGLLAKAGFKPEEMFICNTVSCWPNGTPNEVHMKACRTNLESQLLLAQPRWILLLGGVALSSYRPDLKVGKARGRVLLANGQGRMEPPYIYVAYHPAYALRNGKAEAQLALDLDRFAAMVACPDPNPDGSWTPTWWTYVEDSCVLCGMTVEGMAEVNRGLRFDDWGLPYCTTCWQFRRPA